MRFLVIEGLDGSGKSTQVGLLREYLEGQSIPFKYLHFPRLEEGVYGKLVARFLRGEMGDIDQVDPYLVALIFAGDRLSAKKMIDQWISEDYLVIVDRYVYSNIAFQCAKFKDSKEQDLLKDWILELEFKDNQLPVPEVNIFLDVPFEFTKSRLSGSRSGDDRDYLNGQSDIHEEDLDFQSNVRQIYHSLVKTQENLSIVNCADSKGEMKAPEIIFEQLKQRIGI